MRPEMESLLVQVRSNIAKLEGCKLHQFRPRDGYRIGEKLTCVHCGGTMGLIEIGYYAKGYQAHGGDPRVILPDLPAPT